MTSLKNSINMLDRIQESADFISKKTSRSFKIGIVLGSGLGKLAEAVENKIELDYGEIPNFPISTVEGHSGKLIIGELGGVSVIAMKGRFHYYEGYDLKKATFPIRVFKALGVTHLLLSNASGGLHPDHEIGDIMVLTDHIHLFPDNPLRGKNYDQLGPRFPDMSEPYCKQLIDESKKIAKEAGFKLHYGVYLGTSGPTYETKSEYKYFRYIGADAVGMSTTPETIVAVHAGMKVFAASVVSDLGVEGKVVEISHEEVQEVAAQAEPKLAQLFKKLVKSIAAT